MKAYKEGKYKDSQGRICKLSYRNPYSKFTDHTGDITFLDGPWCCYEYIDNFRIKMRSILDNCEYVGKDETK